MKSSSTLVNLTKKISLLISLMLFSFCLSAQSKFNVEVLNNVFNPSSITIEVGDTIVWTNIEGFHNVNGEQTSYPSNPESFGNNIGSGWTYSYVFNTEGFYEYQCDPHLFVGMIGSITVNEKTNEENLLTINFSSMNPHVGQELMLAVVNQETGVELARISKTIMLEFSLGISGIENGQSYYIDFFADHNANGTYDPPPTDHTWRLELNNVNGDETLNFAHNTGFTDIMWLNMLTINFSNMNPHVGQMLVFYLKDLVINEYIDTITISEITTDFSIVSHKITIGNSYEIDFYTDHNFSNSYDAPPVDHAWRIDLPNVTGDTSLNFAHNTNFTDISISTGNNELDLSDYELVVYPNPATDYIYISSNGLDIDNSEVAFYNSLGTKVHVLPVTTNSNTIGYKVQHLQNGLYFIKYKSPDDHRVVKFIKY